MHPALGEGRVVAVCYGADMVEILAQGLRKTLGTNSAQAVAPEVVRRCLRLRLRLWKWELQQLATKPISGAI